MNGKKSTVSNIKMLNKAMIRPCTCMSWPNSPHSHPGPGFNRTFVTMACGL